MGQNRSQYRPPPRICNFVDFPLVFNEINVVIVAAWVMQFRWFSIGFSTKSAPLHLFVRFPHFVDLLTVFQRNSIHITHWRFCSFRWFTNGFSTKFDASCGILDLWFRWFSIGFSTKCVPSGPFPDLVISLIFHWFFNEMRSWKFIPWFCWCAWVDNGNETKCEAGWPSSWLCKVLGSLSVKPLRGSTNLPSSRRLCRQQWAT